MPRHEKERILSRFLRKMSAFRLTYAPQSERRLKQAAHVRQERAQMKPHKKTLLAAACATGLMVGMWGMCVSGWNSCAVALGDRYH